LFLLYGVWTVSILWGCMTPLVFTITTFVISVVAGMLGSLLGLGGGMILVPILWLLPPHVPLKFASGASIVCVIATSGGAGAAYVRRRMANLRIALFLAMATTAGALTGGYLSGRMPERQLGLIFAAMLGYSAFAMLRKKHELDGEEIPDRLADSLRLHGRYYDTASGRWKESRAGRSWLGKAVSWTVGGIARRMARDAEAAPALTEEEEDGEWVLYRVARSPLGLGLMYVAGVVSGLLGIGSGALRVPAMDVAMKLPTKVSSATSNFLIGITAAATAGVYFMRGQINPFVAAPVAAGVLLGAMIGSRLLGRIPSRHLRKLFVIVLLVLAIQMLWKCTNMASHWHELTHWLQWLWGHQGGRHV